MKRFHYAIKAIDDEIFRCVGKVTTKYVYDNINPMLALQENKVRNLKLAKKILEDHPENKHV